MTRFAALLYEMAAVTGWKWLRRVEAWVWKRAGSDD